MNSGRLRRQRQRMFDASPFCVYCKAPLVLYSLKNHERMPDNYATIDHLRSRLQKNRTERARNGAVRHVLSCHKCNQALAEAEEAALTLEEKWERSGRRRKEGGARND